MPRGASNVELVDPDLAKALAVSHLRDLPPAVLDELWRDSVRTKASAGSVIHREREAAPYLELVVSGVIRVFATAPDGRTMTIRYCRSGELMGAMSLFSPGFSEPATKQAVVDAELFLMSPETVRRLSERHAGVARALLVELSERAQSFAAEVSGNAFSSVRQRVARQLLDLAATHPAERQDGELAVRVTQGELAAAAGTVREVVVRVLRRYRESGVVRTDRERIVILEPALLTDDAKWNSSS